MNEMDTTMSEQQNNLTPYLPGDGKPAPAVMTAEEVALFLRLENGDPMRTLQYFRDEGLLVGFRLGRRVRYRLVDVLDFLKRKAECRRP